MQACDFKAEGPLLADHQNLTGGLHPCVSLVRRALKSPCHRIRGGLKSTSWGGCMIDILAALILHVLTERATRRS